MSSKLPPRPDLAWLKKAAKERLAELRGGDPSAKLHQAQLDISREYGFASWRALKEHVDGISLDGQIIAAAVNGNADELARLAASPPSGAPAVLISSLDPANLYGSGAPLDIPLLEGGTARLTRAASNELVLIGGRPVLIIEGHGRRLTGLASASEAELRSALGLLPTLAGPARRVLGYEPQVVLDDLGVTWEEPFEVGRR